MNENVEENNKSSNKYRKDTIAKEDTGEGYGKSGNTAILQCYSDHRC